MAAEIVPMGEFLIEQVCGALYLRKLTIFRSTAIQAGLNFPNREGGRVTLRSGAEKSGQIRRRCG